MITEPSFQGAIKSIETYYSLQESKPEVFTYTENGINYHISTLIPVSNEQLRKTEYIQRNC